MLCVEPSQQLMTPLAPPGLGARDSGDNVAAAGDRKVAGLWLPWG